MRGVCVSDLIGAVSVDLTGVEAAAWAGGFGDKARAGTGTKEAETELSVADAT